MLPGVPAEMVEMWNDSVAPAIREMPGNRRVIRRRRIHCFGAGESQIESMLPDLIRRGRQPTVGITASKATITLRIAAEGESEAECDATIEPVAATIRGASARWSSARRTTNCNMRSCASCASAVRRWPPWNGERRHAGRLAGPCRQ